MQPLRAGALLIIDEAQNLPYQVLEQIRILSNLETDKEKLLQIVLVGQLNLKNVLRSPELRQLDQRVSIRYELKPLTSEETAAYIGHRLTIAGGGSLVSFAPKALDLVHKYTQGIPRLINLVCDRALLGGYSARVYRLTPEMVTAAAKSLDLLLPPAPAFTWVRQRAGAFAAGAALMAAIVTAAYGIEALRSRAAETADPSLVSAPQDEGAPAAPAGGQTETAAAPSAEPPQVATPAPSEPAVPQAAAPERSSGAPASSPSLPSPAASSPPPQPAGLNAATAADQAGRYSVLVGSFRQPSEAAMLLEQLRGLGYRASTGRVQSGERGTWYQVFAGPYAELNQARHDETRVRQMPGYADARLVTR
jgi:general secretion pathway protein A